MASPLSIRNTHLAGGKLAACQGTRPVPAHRLPPGLLFSSEEDVVLCVLVRQLGG